ncbi:MAG TPA: polysaccharide deacetylase family protein [Burkholderiales bacterium]|nr:polysaccharide deacetylase family protein [Burkholderiales bacterium]
MSAKTALRASLARVLFSAGLTAPGRRGRERLTVATFHRVLPEGERRAYPYRGLVVTPEELDAHLAFFTRHFDCGTLAAQHRRFMGGEATRRPLLAITFDDGQHDNFRTARPVLARHRVKASFFVPVSAVERGELLWHDRLGFAISALLGEARGGTEKLERILETAGLPIGGRHCTADRAAQGSKTLAPQARLRLVEALEQASGSARPPAFARMMSFVEIAELAADGHEIGSHSMTHRMMTECDDEALAYEVSESRARLESRLGRPVESFCYPNGNCDARSAGAVIAAGYFRAVTTVPGRNERGTDPFRLNRYDMDASRTRGGREEFEPAVLALRISGAYPNLR